jgi:hypothetical protein
MRYNEEPRFQGYPLSELEFAANELRLSERMKEAGVYGIAMKAVELYEAEKKLKRAENDVVRWKQAVAELKSGQVQLAT